MLKKVDKVINLLQIYIYTILYIYRNGRVNPCLRALFQVLKSNDF